MMNPFNPEGQELKEELNMLQTQVQLLQQLIAELILKNQQLREALSRLNKPSQP